MKIKQCNVFQMFVLVLVGLWLTPVATVESDPKPGVYDPLRNYSKVDLSKLKKQPKSFKNTEITFRVYFHQIDNVWSPFFSPFSPSDYVSFSGWDHKKHLWKKKDMINDFPFLYIKNGHEEINKILTANKYDLLQLKGTVVSAFKSRPWIEIRHVKVLERKTFTDEELSSFMLANEASRNGNPTLATEYFEKGLEKGELSPEGRAEVHKQLAINYFQASNYELAIDNAYSFQEYADEKDSTVEEVLQEAQKLQEMSPEERNDYERKRLQKKPGAETSLLPGNVKKNLEHPSQLKKKYEILLSRYENVLDERQSLKSKQAEVREQNRRLVRKMKKSKKAIKQLEQTNQELKQKLAEAYQKNARLLARLHGNQDATSNKQEEDRQQRTEGMQANHTETNVTSTRRGNDLREKKLLSKIRTLKRRNRSLRSQMTSLSNQNREAQQEISRLKDQVKLKTSSTDTDQAETEETNIDSESPASTSGTQG